MAIRIANENCEWRIGDNGLNLGFFDKRTGTNYALLNPPSPCAYVKKGGWRADACQVGFSEGILTYRFAGGAGSARISVQIHRGYFLFTVLGVDGDFDELAFVNVPTSLKPEADQPFSACTIALSLLSNVEELPGPQEHLWTAAYRRFGFEGAQTGLVCASFTEMRDVMKTMVGAAPGVPHSPLCGPWAQDAKLPMYSVVMEAPTLQNADAWIDFCRRMGLKGIECNGTLDYGSYLPRPELFPNGFADVRKMVDKFHAAGLIVGLHTLSFSIAKNCSWITPKPDSRLAKEKTYTLASDLDADGTEVFLEEDTSDLPDFISYYVRRSMTLQIGDELIVYQKVRKEGAYSVYGCQRGMHGTAAVPHPRGTKVFHLKECWGCFAPDGDSTLFAEVADRISTAVNECNFDFVYLDGLDGAHIIGGEDARWHYGAKFTFEVFRGLKHPIMMEMATFHHHLWYVRTRMQAWDHNTRDHKKFTDLHVFSNSFARRLFMPLNMGWIGLFPYRGVHTDQTFWDDVEYIYSKSLATNSNLIFQCLNPDSFQNGVWLNDFSPMLQAYENLRQSRHFAPEVCERLAMPGKEYRLCPSGEGKWAFQPIQAERHQVDDSEGITDHWIFQNQFHAQPAGIRIQALPSVAEYHCPEGVDLTELREEDEFRDPGETITILNSGKLYCYPSHAPGMTGELKLLPPEGPADRCIAWTASRDFSDDLIPTSAPEDTFSLLDHFERNYSLHEASWICRARILPEEKDLTACQAMGIWLKGDGQGATLDIVQQGRAHGLWSGHHFVKVDWNGWRYLEFLQTSASEFEELSWPFARCQYELYRKELRFNRIAGVQFWWNGIPKGGKVSCLMSPLRALPLVEQPLVRPVITIGTQSLEFPVTLQTGHYLEYFGEKARIYDGTGNFLGEVAPLGKSLNLLPGDNPVQFQGRKDALRPHARITMFTKDADCFGDCSGRDFPWETGCLAAGPDFGKNSRFHGKEAPQADSFLAP